MMDRHPAIAQISVTDWLFCAELLDSDIREKCRYINEKVYFTGELLDETEYDIMDLYIASFVEGALAAKTKLQS